MTDYSKNNLKYYSYVLCTEPQAQATITGSSQYPNLSGNVDFFLMPIGVLVAVEIYGLPQPSGKCSSLLFGFHIHAGTECSGSAEDPFANSLEHYNPDNCPHPYQAGDLPPLLSSAGHCFEVFLTNQFGVEEIIGKTAIVHSQPDDYLNQPAGSVGPKIGCGVIKRV